LDKNGDYVRIIETFTIYYGLDETNEFRKFLRQNYFTKAHLKRAQLHITHGLYKEICCTLKHVFLFHRAVAGLAGEDMINASGLPYIHETTSDLDCSMLLFRLSYQKGSLQLLRSALETMVLHGYFTGTGVRYEDLRIRKTPLMTARQNGMLAQMVNLNFINPELAGEISVRYKTLSDSVHSQFYSMDLWYEDDKRDRTRYWLTQFKAVGAICTKLLLHTLRYECLRYSKR
jgi:hypothetical protein